MPNTTAQTPGAATVVPGKPGLKARAIDSGKKLLVMTLYLWILFVVLNLHRIIILQQNGIDYKEQGFAIVNALVLAKFMLVADDFKLGARFNEHRLIYSILYSSFIFAVVLSCCLIAEHAIVALVRGRPVVEELTHLGAGNLRGILAVAAIAFVALIPFFTFRGIARVIGEDQLWQLVFSPRPKTFTLVAQE